MDEMQTELNLLNDEFQGNDVNQYNNKKNHAQRKKIYIVRNLFKQKSFCLRK